MQQPGCPVNPAGAPAASARPLAPPSSAAPLRLSASTVVISSVTVAMLMSTEYLFQPFVWRHWPVDEVLIGWLEVARDRLVVALTIGVALVVASHIPAPSLHWRSAVLAAAIVVGATGGELALVVGGAVGATEDTAAVLGRIARWTVVSGSVAAMWYMWRRGAEASAEAQRMELRSVQLERQASEVQLEVLRNQIEPHFLFNTLATVRRLQQVQPEQGSRLLAHFIAYLRSAQPRGRRDGNTLGQEIELTRSYLGVVSLRMMGRLQVSIEVADDLLGHAFPPLTIATLVENAVKHGIAPAPLGGAIAVSVRRVGVSLEAVVVDTGVGFSGSSGTGIGLANIRARLQTLYGTAGSLALQSNQPSGVRASMRVPILPQGSAA